MKNIRNETLTVLTPVEGNTVPYSAVDRYGRAYVISSLPTDAATESKQDDIITELQAILAASGGTSSYALRYDEGATYTYIGEANPGEVTSAASWRVKRLTNADNTIVWADGDSDFDNIWDNRASLSYS
jgi:parallel beta-helix repeat protein